MAIQSSLTALAHNPMLRWQRSVSRAIGLLLCILIPLDAQPIVQSPDSACDAEAFLTANSNLVAIHPEKVIMRPWQGQHQVYGIFMLPKTIHSRDFVVLKVKGVGVYCDIVNRSGTKREGVIAKPGHFLMMDYIRTRTTLALILQGKANLIENPENWVMIHIQSESSQAQSSPANSHPNGL